MTDDTLLQNIQSSIMDMQSQMKDTYSSLADIKVVGTSRDESVKISMTATYTFEDIDFTENAMAGGIKEFKWRIREAWKDVSEKIQQTTQSKTVELLQGMEIPEEIRAISASEEEK